MIGISGGTKKGPKKKAQSVKRKIKDSVFTDLFANKKYLIQLYRALHPEDARVKEDDIENITIKNVLVNEQYNDLGFRIKDRILILVEAQSTWTKNIIVRLLLYLMKSYNDFFKDIKADLYGTTKVTLPIPELYVIYIGNKKVPEVISLQDEFFGGKEVALNAKVKVITTGKPGDIINQYVTFTDVLNDQIKKYGRTRRAIEETIKTCKDMDVLKEYLASREKEVIDIMETLFDEQEVVDRYVASKEKEAELKATVSSWQYFGKSIDETVQFISSKFGLTKTLARTKVKKYWT